MFVHLLRVYIIGADNAIDTLAFNILQDLESLERVKLRILSAEYYSQQLVLAVVVVVVVVVFTEEYMFCLEANSELCSNRSSCSKTAIYSWRCQNSTITAHRQDPEFFMWLNQFLCLNFAA